MKEFIYLKNFSAKFTEVGSGVIVAVDGSVHKARILGYGNVKRVRIIGNNNRRVQSSYGFRVTRLKREREARNFQFMMKHNRPDLALNEAQSEKRFAEFQKQKFVIPLG